MGTMGWLQGAQLKLQRERAQRDQEQADRAKKSFDQNQEAIQQGSQLLAQNPGQQSDWQELLKHHAEVNQQAQQLALKMDNPAPFLQGIKQAMAQDALMLQTAHVADGIHDSVMSGAFDTPDPLTGERVPNEQLRQYFSDLSDQVKAGAINPMQAQQSAMTAAQEMNKQAGEIRHRIAIAVGAEQQLTEMGPAATPQMHQYVDLLKTGQIDTETWQKQAPYVMAGLVQGPSGHWLTPQDAALEAAKTQAETRNINANADYTERVKPAVEMGKVGVSEGRLNLDKGKAEETARHNNATETGNLTLGRGRIASSEKQTTERAQAQRDIAGQRLEAQARKAATESGFSDAKARDKALERALQMFKEGLIKDEEDFQPKVEELYKQFSTKPDGQKRDDSTLIDDVLKEHPDWTDQQVRDEVKKRRGG